MTQENFALVTGASRGLGKYFARALATRGHNLILVARDEQRLARVAEDLTATHKVSVELLPTDLAIDGAGEHLANELSARELAVDLLVNNAGLGDQGEFFRLSLDHQVKMIQLQTSSAVELTHRLLPRMIEQRHGGIINVSSIAGFQPIPYAATYSATKSFVTTFSLALEAEVRRYKVSVVTLCPGRLRADPEDDEGERKKVPGGQQSHDEVVRAALKALDRGGGLVVPGMTSKLIVAAQKLAPRSRVARLIGKATKKHHIQIKTGSRERI